MSCGPWFVAVSNTNCERRATQGLVDAGFEVWFPTLPRLVRIGKSRKTVMRTYPLYGGYLFTRLASAVEWQAMYAVDGIKTVLLNHQRPVMISDEIMEGERRKARIIAAEPAENVLQVGDEVVVKDGPFAGLRASLTRVLGLSAVQVALDAFGRSTALQIDPAKLEKV